MPIPNLTAQDCDDVINIEIQIGAVCIAGKVHNRITYNIKNGEYYVYENKKDLVYSNTFQANAVDFYNNLNKKVDL